MSVTFNFTKFQPDLNLVEPPSNPVNLTLPPPSPLPPLPPSPIYLDDINNLTLTVIKRLIVLLK